MTQVTWTEGQLAIFASLVELAFARTGRNPTEDECAAIVAAVDCISGDPDAQTTMLQ